MPDDLFALLHKQHLADLSEDLSTSRYEKINEERMARLEMLVKELETVLQEYRMLFDKQVVAIPQQTENATPQQTENATPQQTENALDNLQGVL